MLLQGFLLVIILYLSSTILWWIKDSFILSIYYLSPATYIWELC